MRISGRSCAFVLPLLAGAACTAAGGAGTDAPGSAAASPVEVADPDTATASEIPLPGDEALVPPPPDPRAADLLEQLEVLSVGPFAGSVDLRVSGIAAFAETVPGQCTESAGGRGLTMVLADGSVLQLDFGAAGGTSVLRAPGIEVDQTLADVDLRVDDGVSLTADLLTGGTSEPSGYLELTGTCS